MKIKNLALVLGSIVLMTACGDKKKNEETFSTLTIEQHKEKFVDSGLEVVNDLKDLSNLSGIHALNDFFILWNDQPKTAPRYFNHLKSLSAFSKQENGLMLKASLEEEFLFSEDYNEIKGVYTFNASTREFEKTPGEDIICKFPISDSESNNGELSFTNLEFITKTYSIQEGATVQQPTSFRIILKGGSAQLMAFDFAAAYDSNGLPTSISETFTLDPFEVKTSVVRSNSEIAFNQSFKKSDKNIFSSSFTSKGDYAYDNIVGHDDLDNPMDQTILTSANAHIAVGNYKIEGMVDFSSFSKSMGDDFDEDEEITEAIYYRDMAVALNNNSKLFLKYVDNNQIIAKNEFYAYEEVDDYWGTSNWKINTKMKFSDDSEMDGSFFDTGIDELINAVDDLFEDMDDSYRE
jgi:hypothetical protein